MIQSIQFTISTHFFVYTQLNIKTVNLKQFILNYLQFRSI